MDWSHALLSGYFRRMEEADQLRWPQSVEEFEALVGVMQHRLVRFAYCRLGSREDAEDVVQEVLVRAFRDRAKYGAVTNAAPFLFRMVANRATDVLRRRKFQGAPLDRMALEMEAAGLDPQDAAAAAREQGRIEGLLGRLPARQSETIRLHLYADLPFEAVAQAMGCSVPTVKSRFRYGIQKLRRVLKRQGGER